MSDHDRDKIQHKFICSFIVDRSAESKINKVYADLKSSNKRERQEIREQSKSQT